MSSLPLYDSRSRAQYFSYITHHFIANNALSNLPPGPLGFDLEWRPNYVKGAPQNPVAVVQLASADIVLVLQISKMSEFPSKLIEVLYSRNWIKLGVATQHDCQKLYSDWGVSVRNCVNLSLMARSVDNARWKGRYTNPIGLSRLLETYDMTTLAKGKVQRSNWENFLTKSQQVYAANDAHAAYTIYDRLLQLAQVSQPVLHPIYYSFDCIGGALLDPHGHSWVPHNPNYDPGPPPPPKEPKEKPSAQNQLSLSLPGEMHSVIPISDQAPTSSISSTAKASQYHMVFATSTSTLDQ